MGIDLEQISGHDVDFIRSMASEAELRLLANIPEAGREEWITRLWCAKEALGKLIGTGVDTTPHHFEATAIESDGHLHMRHRGSGREAHMTTFCDGGFIVAVGFEAVPSD